MDALDRKIGLAQEYCDDSFDEHSFSDSEDENIANNHDFSNFGKSCIKDYALSKKALNETKALRNFVSKRIARLQRRHAY